VGGKPGWGGVPFLIRLGKVAFGDVGLGYGRLGFIMLGWVRFCFVWLRKVR
jgi:hypothetical protein